MRRLNEVLLESTDRIEARAVKRAASIVRGETACKFTLAHARFGLAVALWGQSRMEEGWAEFDVAMEQTDDNTRAEALRDYRRLRERHPGLEGIAEAMGRVG